VAALTLVTALVAIALIRKVGIFILFAPLALIAVLVPLLNPRIALGLLVSCAILFESSSANVLHFTTDQIHDPLPGHYGLLEVLMALAVVSVAIDALRRHRVPLRPAPFGPVLALLALALLSGSIVGHFGGQGFNAITEQLRPVLPLVIVPWLTVNVIRDLSDLRRAIALIVILIVIKAALGVIGVLTHVGVAVNGTTITYYEATPTWLAMTFLLGMLASVAGRIPVGRIVRWAAPLVLLSLVLSLRRGFWIGTVAAVPVLLIIAIAPTGRRFLLPAAAVVTAALWITISSGVALNSQSPLGQRISSINPTLVAANVEDRYRLDERKNVLAALRASPVVGLGLAVPWQEQYPLSIELPQGDLYTHMAVLWFWLKLGLPGLIAYLGYLLAIFVVGIQVFRRHYDGRVRLGAAGAAAGVTGLLVVETTGTFLGTDLRMTVVIGCVMGLLSLARSQSRSPAALPTAEAAPSWPGHTDDPAPTELAGVGL
jgi:hypothetical protein